MSSRSWIIEANTEHQQSAIRQWMLERADASLLKFYKCALLPDGSRWALITSDGVRCVDDLRDDFQYQGIAEITEDEWPQWCLSNKALCSEYLDADLDEFFQLDSPELADQKGLDIFVESAPNNYDFNRSVRSVISAPRLFPEISLGYWELADDHAKYRGRVVGNLSKQDAESLRHLGYTTLPFTKEAVGELKQGFILSDPGVVTLFVGRDSRGLLTQEYPVLSFQQDEATILDDLTDEYSSSPSSPSQ